MALGWQLHALPNKKGGRIGRPCSSNGSWTRVVRCRDEIDDSYESRIRYIGSQPPGSFLALSWSCFSGYQKPCHVLLLPHVVHFELESTHKWM
jgi:hypothetical protein